MCGVQVVDDAAVVSGGVPNLPDPVHAFQVDRQGQPGLFGIKGDQLDQIAEGYDLNEHPHRHFTFIFGHQTFTVGVHSVVQQLAGDLLDLVDGLDHMYRDADGAGLVGDGAGDGLTDPPGGVGGELEALGVVELFHRFDQADLEKMLYIKAHLQKDMAHFHIDARQLDEIGKV